MALPGEYGRPPPEPPRVDRGKSSVWPFVLVGILLVAFAFLVVVGGAVAFWLVKRNAPAGASSATCPGGDSYCSLPLPLAQKGLREVGLELRLEPAKVDVSPKQHAVVVSGTFKHDDRSELEILQLGLRLYDAAGVEMAVIPIKAYQHFRPPLRSGDSAPWYERAPVSAVPRRGELFVLERRVVPAPAAPDDGTVVPLEFPPSAPKHFKLSAFVREREKKKLSMNTSGKMVVAIQNSGEGVVRELKIALVPRGGVGRDLERSRPETIAYSHMPAMYPGERRVAALSYYVLGDVDEEKLVVTDIK